MKESDELQKPTAPRRQALRDNGSTKVRRPRLAQAYARRRLFRTLDAARKQHRIAWITGPPGAGKTTLASSYVETRNLICLWYQIDASDRDVASFFHYLTQAVRVALPQSRKVLPRLTPEQLPTLGMFARRYFQALFASFRHPAMLVFDNYHALPPDSPLHEIMREGLAGLPSNVNVVFVSRSDPPAEFARWLVHGQMTLVDAQTLKLDLEEATGIARRLGAKRSRDDAIRQAHAQTDGWAAGVVLLLERRHQELDAPEAAPPQALFDYFADEIFRHLDADTRRMLLESALLPAMRAATVVKLTGEPRSAAVLADLARRDYFTVRSARTETTYQFHSLFRDFLLREIKTTYPPDHLLAVQCRAASLLEAEDRIEDAVELLRDAAAWDDLTRIIVTAAPSLAAQARLETLANWIGLLPANVSDNAWLLYWRAQCRLMNNPAEAHALSEQAFAQFEQTDDVLGLYLSWSSGVNAIAANWLYFKGLDRWLDTFDALQRRHPVIPTAEAEARVTFSMMKALTNVPARPDLAHWLERATALTQALPDVNHRLLVGASLAIYHTYTGNMKALARVIETLAPLHVADDVAPIADISWRIALSMYHWVLAGNPEKSIEIVDDGLRLAETSGAHAMNLILLMHGIYASFLVNDPKRALAYRASMQAIPQKTDPAFLVTYHRASTIMMIHNDEIDEAYGHAQQALICVRDTGGMFQTTLAHLDMAWLLCRLRKPAEARPHLDRARALGQAMNSRAVEYACLATEAGAALDQDRPDAAVERLRIALALDRDMGGILGPVRPAREWTRLYALALDHGIEVDHVCALIRKRKLVPVSPPLEVENWPWPYRLYTLGRFSIVKDDQPLALSGKGQKKSLELLKTLVALGGRDVSQQQLAEILWPDADGDAAQHAFETALYRLRKLFGDETPLILKDGRLSLDARVFWVDCWALERLLSKVEDTLRTASSAGIEPLTNKLFGLYRGLFLGREADVSAALPLRERLRSRFLRTLQECGRRHEAEQDWERAIACYQRAIEVEPLAETFYRNLMNVYSVLGRHAEAIAAYERCKTVLRSLHNVGPSRETEALRQSVEAASVG